MKKISIYFLSLMAVLLCGLQSCGQFEPKETPDVPELPKATNLKAEVSGRTVNLSWTLPQSADIVAVRVSCNNGTPVVLEPTATSCTLKGQEMERDNVYTVKIAYKDGYVSEGVSIVTNVPFVESKMAYLLTASDAASLPDDDERRAAEWFSTLPNAEFIQVSDLAGLDPEVYSVLWIDIDRVGQEYGWENLPAGLGSDEVIAAIRKYSADGGSIYLSDMATQLTVPLGMVQPDQAPTLWGNGEGGRGDDVWCINPYLGWDFQNGSDQGFYDRTAHDIFKGLTMEDPNGYGYNCLPLIGPGQREDHNCMWDCNIYGKGDKADVIANFEAMNNCMVLATWGHVRDHCVAGLVDFFATDTHGRCVANGFSAYEFNQNSGENPYQHNVETLTLNILNYLK